MTIFKRILVAAGMLILAASAFGQDTTVTATVTDSDGTAWANGTVTWQYVKSAGSGVLTDTRTGQTISPTQGTLTLDASGSMSLANIVPTQYVYGSIPGLQFTVCPGLINAQCYTTAAISIGTTTPQSVSTQINAVIKPPRITGGIGAQAYADVEVSAFNGNQYYNVISNVNRYYQGGVWTASGDPGSTYVSKTQVTQQTMAGPLETTSPGIFSNLASYCASQGFVNGASLSMFTAGGSTNYTQDGICGAVIIPNTSTKWQSNGANGMVDNYTSNSPELGGTAGVGGYFQARGYGTNSYVWGVNLVAIGYGAGAYLQGNETDMDVFNTGQTVIGLDLAGPQWNYAPVYSAGIALQPPGGTSGAKWGAGLVTNAGSTGSAVIAGPASTGSNSASSQIDFQATSSGGTTLAANIYEDSSGTLQLVPGAGGTINFGATINNISVQAINGSINPNIYSIGTYGLRFAPATNGASPFELYGTNATNSAINWSIGDTGNASFNTVAIASARKGTFVCTAGGTITIANTNELSTSDVIISLNTAGGTITTPPAMKTVTAGTGFSVLCGASDTSTYNYSILN